MTEKPKTPDPLAAARHIGRPPQPRRTYKEASVGPHESGFAVLLDGHIAKTPAGNPLALTHQTLALALAAEWGAQGERLDPASMPLTRIVNSAFDAVASQMKSVRADIARHGQNDLICYRADGPDDLVARQEAQWSPLMAFAHEKFVARFVLAKGIVHVAQDPRTLAAIDQALEGYGALSLAAMHTVTTLTGSVVIALAVAHDRLTVEAAWVAANVDEDWQVSQWGEDDLALETRAFRWREMEAAGVVLAGSSGG